MSNLEYRKSLPATIERAMILDRIELATSLYHKLGPIIKNLRYIEGLHKTATQNLFNKLFVDNVHRSFAMSGYTVKRNKHCLNLILQFVFDSYDAYIKGNQLSNLVDELFPVTMDTDAITGKQFVSLYMIESLLVARFEVFNVLWSYSHHMGADIDGVNVLEDPSAGMRYVFPRIEGFTRIMIQLVTTTPKEVVEGTNDTIVTSQIDRIKRIYNGNAPKGFANADMKSLVVDSVFHGMDAKRTAMSLRQVGFLSESVKLRAEAYGRMGTSLGKTPGEIAPYNTAKQEEMILRAADNIHEMHTKLVVAHKRSRSRR